MVYIRKMHFQKELWKWWGSAKRGRISKHSDNLVTVLSRKKDWHMYAWLGQNGRHHNTNKELTFIICTALGSSHFLLWAVELAPRVLILAA